MPSFDFLVIGSGTAGLSTALGLSRLGRVALLSKGRADDSASDRAQGGIAAVMDMDHDSIALHVEDTLGAGAGLCHPQAVRQIIGRGPDAVRQLIDWGVPFDRQPDGSWHLTREGGHQARRILHSADTTGHVIESTLLRRVLAEPAIQMAEGHYASDLWLTEDRCQGAWVLPPKGDHPELWTARAVVLASGGAGQLYPHTSNPLVATGDGIALAWRAGAEIANLEFIQFHPTTLYQPGSQPFLLSEALRGEGAILRLPDGSTFLERYDPRAELAPRDIVARAIDLEMKQHQLDYVTLDISAQPATLVRRHFPAIFAHCRAQGYDLTRESIPVVPAAHYTCGGVVVDGAGRSTIPGLYAAGEVSSTGLHGANRLASNSLLECVVGAAAIVADLEGQARLPDRPRQMPGRSPGQPTTAAHRTDISALRQNLQANMWQAAGIVRNDEGLRAACAYWDERGTRISDSLCGPQPYQELRNLCQCAKILTCAALLREESRGCHFNSDHPQRRAVAADSISQRDQQSPFLRPIPGAV
ncbi:L-aspartate oxidase [Acidithiobacillus ferrooxidans F221]|uniref:L-aspartate oxidase n=1 Tax=Acidithiobacillus ferrooxidans TaxID=920 RepID=UPI001C075FF8|nr:L-aspartate oxidase [Acidithiobacillus ferrooxidans]MBU2808784.1 L-aspartate oxidase [Acidithiobacillus ferrooxidans F221]